jgi:hypothetical protein
MTNLLDIGYTYIKELFCFQNEYVGKCFSKTNLDYISDPQRYQI